MTATLSSLDTRLSALEHSKPSTPADVGSRVTLLALEIEAGLADLQDRAVTIPKADEKLQDGLAILAVLECDVLLTAVGKLEYLNEANRSLSLLENAPEVGEVTIAELSPDTLRVEIVELQRGFEAIQ